eukprot:m.308415 g.308415  ORF g.308415 m.308415 type:complete len:658 (+) comp43961_c0_seq1:62-2035(+)
MAANEKEKEAKMADSQSPPEDTKQFLMYFVYGVALVAVWGFLSAPTVLYVMPKQTACTATNEPPPTMEPLPAEARSTRCERLNSSSFCTKFIGARPNDLIFMPVNRSQQQTEANLRMLLDMMDAYATPACVKHGNPTELLCQIAFPHCGHSEDGMDYGVPMCPSGCRRAEKKYCQFEWTAAKAAAKLDPVNFGALKIAPCDSSPDEADTIYSCTTNATEIEALVDDGMAEKKNNSVSTCPYPLVPSSLPDVPCSPRCGQWSWNSLGESDAITACTWVAFIICVVSSLLVFFNWATVKSLHTFPGIIALYINICAFAGTVVIGIGLSMGKRSAFCSAEDWATAFLKPTNFCTVQGAIYHFATISMYTWWMFLLVNHVFTLMSSNLSSAFQNHRTAIHVAESLFGWGMPALLVGAVFLKDKEAGYGLQSTDPLACGPVDLSTGYFTLSLPLQIIFIVALTIVLLFFALRDCRPTLIYWSDSQVKKVVAQPVGKLEKRYIILIAAFPVMCLFFFAPQIPLMFNSKRLECDLMDYFICMTIRKDPTTCPQDYRRYLYPVLFCIGALSMCVSSYALLFFVALSKESRKSWRRHKDRLHNLVVRVGWRIEKNRCGQCKQCDIIDKEKKFAAFSDAKKKGKSKGDEIGERYASLSDCKQCVTAF